MIPDGVLGTERCSPDHLAQSGFTMPTIDGRQFVTRGKIDAGRTFAVVTPEFVVPYKCASTGIMAEMDFS
jgi:hypothetical protein